MYSFTLTAGKVAFPPVRGAGYEPESFLRFKANGKRIVVFSARCSVPFYTRRTYYIYSTSLTRP
jgi:hypothetical protein